MKLSKIYANKQFKNIEFNPGFNVIIGRIFDKSKSDKDTHSLGKSRLIDVVDFLLLKKISKKKEYFLTNRDIFKGQNFYAELELNNGQFLIIRRSVDMPSRVSFKLNDYRLTSFVLDISWDEEALPFAKAVDRLNEYLTFDVLPRWKYRKSLTYFLRTQGDFLDVFKLDKFSVGKHKDWKPMVFDLLGFEGDVIREKAEYEEQKEELENQIKTLKTEIQLDTSETDKIQGILDIKQDDRNRIESKIDRFNFYEQDKHINQKLVDEIDAKIQILNSRRYGLTYDIDKINHSLSQSINEIDLAELNTLYKEIKIYFPDQLIKCYEDLLN